MIIFQKLIFIGKTERGTHFDLIVRPVLPVAPFGGGLAEHHGGQALKVGHFLHIVLDAVFVAVFRYFLFLAALVGEHKGDARVDNGLALNDVLIIFTGHVDIGEHFGIRLPTDGGARFFAGGRLFFQPSRVFPFAEIQVIMETVPVNIRRHPFGRILRGAQAQTVQAQGVFVIVRAGGVFAARVHLAEQQLPVVALLVFIVIHRHAAAEVLHLYRAVLKLGDENAVAVALTRLIDGVGQYLENGMGAAVHAVGAKNNAGTLAHPVGALQGCDAFIGIGGRFSCHSVCASLELHICDRFAVQSYKTAL